MMIYVFLKIMKYENITIAFVISLNQILKRVEK